MNSHLRILEEGETPPNDDNGGDSGGGGNMNLEPRVARIEAHIEHIDTSLSDMKQDIRELRTWLIGGFIILTGSLATGFLYLISIINQLPHK
jgi:hypothetical protein